ncbi:unnamed protein product, partial [Rotaria sordida]
IDEECEEAAVKKRYLGIVKKLTSIKRQAIPIGLQNRDVISFAKTDSDKTADRLIDVLENHYLTSQQCIYIVMDEADRMIG